MKGKRPFNEIPKDFKSSMIRLVNELNTFKVLIIISLLLAALGSIIAIFTPNILSNLTDTISEGLVVNTKNIEKISSSIEVNEEYSFTQDELKGTDLLKLDDVKVEGEINKNSLGNIELNLYVEGVMVLPCAITLNPVNYPFSIEISGEIEELMENFDENERNFQNSIDILPIIWENILMEIPMRVVSEEAKNSDITMEGKGWKFVTEEEDKKSPLSELMDMLDDSEVR